MNRLLFHVRRSAIHSVSISDDSPRTPPSGTATYCANDRKRNSYHFSQEK